VKSPPAGRFVHHYFSYASPLVSILGRMAHAPEMCAGCAGAAGLEPRGGRGARSGGKNPMRAWKYKVFVPQSMSLLAPLTKILPKSYQNLTKILRFLSPDPPILPWLGCVLKVEMTASARDFTSFTTEACELTQVAYRHIKNTTATLWEVSTRRVAVGSRRFGGRFRVDTAVRR
jgi:hypothetical protein